VHLAAAIALRRNLLASAASHEERGTAHNNLGNALAALGERENAHARALHRQRGELGEDHSLATASGGMAVILWVQGLAPGLRVFLQRKKPK
jgi:hypothetical protein